ncbi:MAG: FAD-dependent oxidoreductase [Pseudomonas veronii]|nr:FAD-dependent oxidoreductase [Pseudomonas veronii]
MNIHLNHPVQHVAWDEHGVWVDALNADACICTVPIPVLKHLHFTPGLPTAYREALAFFYHGPPGKGRAAIRPALVAGFPRWLSALVRSPRQLGGSGWI